MHRETGHIKPPPTRIRRAIELGLASVFGTLALGVSLWAFLNGEWFFVLFAIVPAWVARTLYSGDYSDGVSKNTSVGTIGRLDFMNEPEWSNVPGNINHEHYQDTIKPPPP